MSARTIKKLAAERAYRETHREERAAYQRAYYEKHRENITAAQRAYYEAHREEEAARSRARYEANPEREAARKRDWRKANRGLVSVYQARRRALKAGAPRVEKIDRAYVYERDGGRCHICRKKAPQRGFHLDHLIPLSKGGEHTHDNVAVAHASCNARRGAGRLPAQLRLPDPSPSSTGATTSPTREPGSDA